MWCSVQRLGQNYMKVQKAKQSNDPNHLFICIENYLLQSALCIQAATLHSCIIIVFCCFLQVVFCDCPYTLYSHEAYLIER